MVTTIPMQVSGGVAELRISYPLPFESACQLLGIGVGSRNPRPTYKSYRDQMAIPPGGVIADREAFIKLSLMHQFANYRSGPHFSRQGFTNLLVQHGSLDSLRQYLSSTYGIVPSPLTLSNDS